MARAKEIYTTVKHPYGRWVARLNTRMDRAKNASHHGPPCYNTPQWVRVPC
ncbi:hypothetical protein Fmac_029646 [Flemingia macrophylla]|uniref:Uncharacterized protein n=1 Tax=Flemingia macrophylla TaxID=520843 RepID=A0ABD1LAY7_9FABA